MIHQAWSPRLFHAGSPMTLTYMPIILTYMKD